MTTKGFANRQTRRKQAKENRSKPSPRSIDDTSIERKLWEANMLLRTVALCVQVPVISPWRNTGKDEFVPGRTELPPDVDGITIALCCTADEAQELVDFMLNFERRRRAKQEGLRNDN